MVWCCGWCGVEVFFPEGQIRLSFFGVGVQPLDATWGSVLYQAHSVMTTEPWLALFPGACIVLAAGGLTLVADRA